MVTEAFLPLVGLILFIGAIDFTIDLIRRIS